MKKTLALAALALTLAACKQQPAPEAAAAPAETAAPSEAVDTAPAAPVDAVVAVSGPMLAFEPARLDACDPAVEATVRWNVASIPGVERIELYTSSGTLFAAGGAVGEAKTGMWGRPGTRLEMRNPDSNEVLAEAVIGGPECAVN